MAVDLYFAGTQCKEAEEIIESNGYCRLYSYLNDKKNLAKINKYKEAEKLRVINEKLKEKENENYEKEKSAKINRNMEALETKQKQELKTLVDKQKRSFDILLSKKEKEFATLESKYKGKMQNLEAKEKKQQMANKEINEE